MKRSFLFIALLGILFFSCSSNDDLAPATVDDTELLSQNLYHYTELENLVVSESDFGLSFLFYVDGVLQIKENNGLTENQVISAIENYDNFTEATFFNKANSNPLISESVLSDLNLIYNGLKEKGSSIEAISFIENTIIKLGNTEKNEESDFSVLLLKGYETIIKFKSDYQLSSSRDCVSNCIASNSFGFLWWSFHNQYANSNPFACWQYLQGFTWSCPQASSFANRQLRYWCISECKNNDDTPPYPCYGVHCIQGYHCVDGDCVIDPFFEGCQSDSDCLEGEHCVHGTCIPW